MTTALVPVGDLERMADAIAASKLFGTVNKEQALALMLVAQAEGLHPATAARDYHVIQGRPTLKADAMLARYLNSGGKVEWHEHTDQKVSATFSHPAGGSLRIEWDFARAKQAGLGSKDMWLKYPRQMLRARVVSEGIRATNPGVAVGVYTPEEVSDFEPADKRPGARAKPMGDAQIDTSASADILREFSDRIDAAADMPALLAVGQDIPQKKALMEKADVAALREKYKFKETFLKAQAA